jgi:uncharacterized protein (TIGR00369 family)
MSAFKPAQTEFAAVVRDSFNRQGLMRTLGARLVVVNPGHVEIECDYSDSIGQQQGLFHGGVIGSIADSAGGYAALSLMPPGSDVVTVEYKINFMRGARGPLLRATGHIIRAGRTLSVAKVDVTAGPQGAQDACALVQATFIRV